MIIHIIVVITKIFNDKIDKYTTYCNNLIKTHVFNDATHTQDAAIFY